MDFDLTGSIYANGTEILDTVYGSLGDGLGSSAIDTVLRLPRILFTAAVSIAQQVGADAGSTMFGESAS